MADLTSARPNSQTNTIVVVGVCTFRRAKDLNNLLHSIADLSVPSNVAISVVIVDNDLHPSAEGTAQGAKNWMPFPVRYVHEPTSGIPFARNRVLKEAGEVGFLAFVDDDETVDSQWIIELLSAQRKTGGTFIQGPVVMSVREPADEWWLSTTFFAQNSFANLAPIGESWTNNVLIDLEFIKSRNIQFEKALQFEGGEDTLFFQDVVASGGSGFFATQALVYEVQQESRLSWRWGLFRQYRYGITRAKTAVLRRSRRDALGFCLIRGSGMIIVGLMKLPTALVNGKHGIVSGLALMARGFGVFSGFFGRTLKEYGA